MGHEAATIAVALEIAATCDQLVCGPEIATRALVKQGRLVEVRVPGLRRATPLFVHVSSDRVRARIHNAVVDGLKELLDPSPSSVETTVDAPAAREPAVARATLRLAR